MSEARVGITSALMRVLEALPLADRAKWLAWKSRCQNVGFRYILRRNITYISFSYFRMWKIALIDLYRKEFEGQPFVRICHSPPSTSQTRHTNFLDIHPLRIGHRVVVVASLDNLIRGASGVAVQNFNLMNGWPQTTALLP